MLQFDACVGGGALPLEGSGLRIAVAAPGGCLGGHPGLFGEAAVEALPGQDARLALGHAGWLPWGGV